MSRTGEQKGKMDAKTIGLAVLLLAALGGVYFSYRMTNAPVTVSADGTLISQAQNASLETADRLMKSVEARLQEDAQRVPTDWAEVAAPIAQEHKSVVASAAKEAPTFKLRGVVHGGAQAMAFINETTVGLGETILGSRVIAITNDSVTLVDGQGKQHVLSLYEN
jgi:type II secretory pathway component PulC